MPEPQQSYTGNPTCYIINKILRRKLKEFDLYNKTQGCVLEQN